MAVTLRIEQIIVTVRGQRVILDSDLAAIYGVTTKALNQAVRRNAERFPTDFVFRLTLQEATDLRSQIVTSGGEGERPRILTAEDSEENRSQIVTGSQKHRDPRFRPYAFTEHGALMAANVLRSQRAVEMSVFVVRAFVRLRHWLAGHAELSRRLDDLERKYCAVRNLGDTSEQTAQSAGRVREGQRPAPLGRARGEGRALAMFLCKRGGLPHERSGAGAWKPNFRTAEYDSRFKEVFEAIRQLMTPSARKRKEIGFHVREPRATYGTRRKGR